MTYIITHIATMPSPQPAINWFVVAIRYCAPGLAKYFVLGAALAVLTACTSVANPTQNAQNHLVSTGDVATDRQAQAFKATQLWSEAHEAKPTDIVNILGYAKALASIGSNTLANKVLTDGLLIYPNNSDILRAQAKALSKQGLVGPALRKMNLAIKNNPDDWRLYNDIGSIHSKMGEKTLALDSFKHALKLAPDEPSIHTNLGVTYMLDRQLILAEKHLAIAVKHPEATRQMRQNYAFVLGLQGKYALARKIFLQDLPLSQVDENIAQLKKINGDI